MLVLLTRIATHFEMMITMKNDVMKIAIGVTTIVNTGIMIGQRDRGLHNHIAADRKTSSTM